MMLTNKHQKQLLGEEHPYGRRFLLINRCGKGSFSTVYKAYDYQLRTIVALKEVIDPENAGFETHDVEIFALKLLGQHSHVVKLLDVVYPGRAAADSTIDECQKIYRIPTRTVFACLVLEFADTNLDVYIRELYLRDSFGFAQFRGFLQHLLLGVNWCHQHRIVHCDLKPANLLIYRNTVQLKVADFGISRGPGIYPDELLVTIWYRPPELMLGDPNVSMAVDMWSVGCIAFQMLNGNRPLFPGNTEVSQLFNIFQVFGTPDEKSWPGLSKLPYWNPNIFPSWKLVERRQDALRSLLKAGEVLVSSSTQLEAALDFCASLLQYNPASRPSARECLNHKVFECP